MGTVPSLIRVISFFFLVLLVVRHSKTLRRWRRSCTALTVGVRSIVSGRRLRHLRSPALFHLSLIAGVTCKNLAYLPPFLPTRNVTISQHAHKCASLSPFSPPFLSLSLSLSPLSSLPFFSFFSLFFLYYSYAAISLLRVSPLTIHRTLQLPSPASILMLYSFNPTLFLNSSPNRNQVLLPSQ